MELNLTGKVAIVTGSSRGLGLASARALVAEGCRVCICARGAERLAEAAADIGAVAKIPNMVTAVQADVSTPVGAELVVARTFESFGGIDILVCNAAINPHYGPLEELTDQVFERMMTNNVLSNLWLSKLVASDMKAKREGSIIFISSTGGLKSSRVIAMYGVTKAADIALCRSLAAELGPHNIRVNCVLPGPVLTAAWKDVGEEDRRASVEQTAAGRFGDPDEVASVISFLSSAEASYVTGVSLPVDGGWSIYKASS